MKKEQPISAVEIAKLLLSYDQKREYFNDNKMTSITDEEINPTQGNFRINKMLHICQMLHYSKYREPLFFWRFKSLLPGSDCLSSL